MTRFRPLVLLAFVLLTTASAEAARRRAVSPGWRYTAYPLHSVELVADTSDLASLAPLVTPATIVALGDDTHGTHEFFTMKLRLIDYLVREHGFDVLSIEAPFPIVERINVYVQGGAGDPRALLQEARVRLNYLFWDVEELLAVIESLRAYNLGRGDAPAVELAGADIYDEAGAADAVVQYLRTVDPSAATVAEEEYECVRGAERHAGCEAFARRVRDALAARREELVPLRGERAYDDALHHADVVMEFFPLPLYEPRERSMAANLDWIRTHRGKSGKVIHWGHQEHVGKARSPYTRGITMGMLMAAQLGDRYVAIGTLTGSGTFLQWEGLGSTWNAVTRTFPDPEPGTYEWLFRRNGLPAMLVPLRGSTLGAASFRTAGTTSGWTTIDAALGEKLDAVIYVDITTATRPLP
jgi:erythromycin esterase